MPQPKTRLDSLLNVLGLRRRSSPNIETELQGLFDYMQEVSRWQPILRSGNAQGLNDLLGNLGELNLSEVDSQYVDLLQRLVRAQAGTSSYRYPSEQERMWAVGECRTLDDNDPASERIVGLWTDFGYGTHIEVTPRDEDAIEYWEEFWSAKRNRPILSGRYLHEHSARLLVDGEFFFVISTSRLTGESTIRVLLTEEVSEIITDKDDSSVPLYYVRTITTEQDMTRALGAGAPQTIYYADWMADDDDMAEVVLPTGAVRADDITPHTDVVVIHVAHRRRLSSTPHQGRRGWPLMTTGAPWARAYRDFLQNRAAVARAVATYVDKLITTGKSTAVDAMINRFQSSLATTDYGSDRNPVPTAGSTWAENEALRRERMPLSTGAGDAEKDGGALLAQVGLAGGVYPHWLGRGEVHRLATATSMAVPMLRQWERYQLFWSSIWTDVAEVVLRQCERYSEGATEFETYEVDVTTDSLIMVELEDIVEVASIIKSLADLKAVSTGFAVVMGEQLMRIALQSLGVRNTEDLFESVEAADDEIEKEKEENPPPTFLPTLPEPDEGEDEGDEGDEDDEPLPGEDDAVEIGRNFVRRMISEVKRDGSLDPDDVAQYILGTYADYVGEGNG